ncbi:hypothetical protein HDV63DRAFT_373671 [Trichoderma sp. SZMC 28014]
MACAMPSFSSCECESWSPTDPLGSVLCPIAAKPGRQRQQQRQKRCRFAGFHGRVSATIVVSVCMLSLLSVAVGANGLGQARSRAACLARLLADASQAGCRRAASSTKPRRCCPPDLFARLVLLSNSSARCRTRGF